MAERVIQEIEELIERYDPKMMVCRDNAVNGENLLKFCSLFRHVNKPWIGAARGDLSRKEIEALRNAGCRLIYFGLESGSDRILNIINKGISANQLSLFIRALYDNNIIPMPSLFVGTPGETEEDFERTVRFVQDHRDYFEIINLYPLMMTPASEFSLTQRKEASVDALISLIRLNRLIEACTDLGMKVCVREQTAEYIMFDKVYRLLHSGSPNTPDDYCISGQI